MCVLYVYVHICADVLACGGMCGGHRLIPGCLLQLLLHSFFWGRVLHWTQSSLIQLDWVARRPRIHLSLPPSSPELGLQPQDTYLSFYTGIGNLNSGPNACMTCTLPTDVSSQLPPFIKELHLSLYFPVGSRKENMLYSKCLELEILLLWNLFKF